jgi:hypothetical protein
VSCSADTLPGLKSIGKAGKAVGKQLGKTLTKIGDSPDKRGFNKLKLAQNPQLQSAKDQRPVQRARVGLGLDSSGTFVYMVAQCWNLIVSFANKIFRSNYWRQ